MSVKYLAVSRDEIRRLLFLKKEIKRILLKSIYKNQQIKPIYRGFCVYKIQQDNIMTSRQKNICIITGKNRGIYSVTNTSRHALNKMLQEGFITNMKTNNTK